MLFERERRGASRNLQSVDLGKGIKQFFRQPIGEVFLLLVAAEIHERKHRDRVRWRSEGGRCGRCRCTVLARGRALSLRLNPGYGLRGGQVFRYPELIDDKV